MSKQMEDAVEKVRSAARAEAFHARPVSVFGCSVEQIGAALRYFEMHTGIPAHEVDFARRVLIFAPDYRSAVHALAAHRLPTKHPRLVIVTPDNRHFGYGWDRETPYSVVLSPTKDTAFWSMMNEMRARYHNEPSDLHVAFVRAGII